MSIIKTIAFFFGLFVWQIGALSAVCFHYVARTGIRLMSLKVPHIEQQIELEILARRMAQKLAQSPDKNAEGDYLQ